MSARLLLSLALLLAACGSRGPAPSAAPAGVPADFRLEVVSRGATNPHCDFDVGADAAGNLRYEVHHRGAQAADRRGRTILDPAAVRALWAAVERGGMLDLPAALPPQEGGQERGVVTFRVRAGGRERTVVADHAGTPGTDGVLAAVFGAVPLRVWRVPGAE